MACAPRCDIWRVANLGPLTQPKLLGWPSDSQLRLQLPFGTCKSFVIRRTNSTSKSHCCLLQPRSLSRSHATTRSASVVSYARRVLLSPCRSSWPARQVHLVPLVDASSTFRSRSTTTSRLHLEDGFRCLLPGPEGQGSSKYGYYLEFYIDTDHCVNRRPCWRETIEEIFPCLPLTNFPSFSAKQKRSHPQCRHAFHTKESTYANPYRD